MLLRIYHLDDSFLKVCNRKMRGLNFPSQTRKEILTNISNLVILEKYLSLYFLVDYFLSSWRF
jgi:hypothetical protein